MTDHEVQDIEFLIALMQLEMSIDQGIEVTHYNTRFGHHRPKNLNSGTDPAPMDPQPLGPIDE